jgi:octaprenyl-diphosphate synthase
MAPRRRKRGGLNHLAPVGKRFVPVPGQRRQESQLGEQFGDIFQSEHDLVAATLDDVIADLPEGLSQFVRSELAEKQILAGVVLASAAPEHDSAEDESRRVALAAALELLKIALSIHRLLLKPEKPDSIDNMLLGGTILAGDYCFSRAAVLAARTCHPQVVTVFAELLKEISQANLRRVIVSDNDSQKTIAASERRAMFHSGASAGVLLAGLSDEEQAVVVRYAEWLSLQGSDDETGSLNAGAGGGLDRMPPRQRERWRELVSSL